MQVSLFNFVQYNVIGGGQSALYGIESWTFYIKNGILNFNVALLLAAAFPALNLLVILARKSPIKSSRTMIKLCTSCAPGFVWILAISCLPHKEERFLYVVYPHVRTSKDACVEFYVDLSHCWTCFNDDLTTQRLLDHYQTQIKKSDDPVQTAVGFELCCVVCDEDFSTLDQFQSTDGNL